MLEGLCGNKNVERVLLFLFVHGSTYGAKLQKVLKCPLTPIQKALLRLEKGGIVTSYYEGKTRLYEFNPAYPLLSELELLLKKSYTLLTPQEKKLYSFVQKESSERSKYAELLHEVWKRLTAVKKLTFQARTKKRKKKTGTTGWDGRGTADVIVTKENSLEAAHGRGKILVFTEKGTRTLNTQQEKEREGNIGFSNVLRWTLDEKKQMISLEHLRRGHEHPVFLFHFAVRDERTLSSIDAHLCEGDSYFGEILCDERVIRLHIRVIGAKKNEEIDYYYS